MCDNYKLSKNSNLSSLTCEKCKNKLHLLKTNNISKLIFYACSTCNPDINFDNFEHCSFDTCFGCNDIVLIDKECVKCDTCSAFIRSKCVFYYKNRTFCFKCIPIQT